MMADEIDVHEAFSGDVSRFDAFWAKQRQLEPTTDRSLARLAWQTALQTLPCGHPAACGDPCGWCAALANLREARFFLAEAISELSNETDTFSDIQSCMDKVDEFLRGQLA